MTSERGSTDEELVERAQRARTGDLRAFEELVGRHQARVTANCHHLSGSRTDAEDLAQEVFIKAFFGLRQFEGRAKFSTWLQRIKVNHCLNFLRKRKGKVFVDVDDPVVQTMDPLTVEGRAERSVEAQSERERISRTLELISETLRIPLVMRDMDDLSYQEIADELGIGLSAVKMRIKRGREEFRRLYDELAGVAPSASEAKDSPDLEVPQGSI